MAILLPGGAGYIGSHTAVELLKQGKDIVIVDNFSNSNQKALDAIKELTGKDFKFYEIDYMDREKLEKVFDFLHQSQELVATLQIGCIVPAERDDEREQGS